MSTFDLSEPAAAAERCPRCGERADEAGWCGVCGADLVPDAAYPRFSRSAKDREARWLADPQHSDMSVNPDARSSTAERSAHLAVAAAPASGGAATSLGGGNSTRVVSPEEHSILMSQRDAAELAARRAHDAQLAVKYYGWKPLVIWYAFWALVFAIAALSSLASGGIGTFFVGAAVSGLSAKYSHYLYNGGLRRVWFVIW
jgi:hypothetical protein